MHYLNNYDISWSVFINNSKYLSDMLLFVNNTKNLSPSKDKVFRFFETNLNKIKCVILGMDPYPSNVATGRAFEINSPKKFTDKYKQKSLSVIFKTLWYYKFNEILELDDIRNSDKLNYFKYIYIKDWFDNMEKNGVLFLNSTLTTILNNSNVHTKIWEPFMNELINFINMNNKCVLWMTWGKNAYNRIKGFVNDSNIIYSCHPATRVNNDFVEKCCFKQIKSIEWA